ncbi:hypothetical protein [Pelagerythrobacter sp.]|uniref:hypothetical protein n=1 Tax=Pelagerythrobacter sp. TaxID=2800702 RepID=UPI0035B0510E
MRKTIAAAMLVVALAACDSGADDAAEGTAAEGEVLGGTISDAMLPLDTVQSQSPPLRDDPAELGTDGEAQDQGDAPAEPADDAASDAPASEPETPAPEPEPAAPDGDGEGE